MAIRKNYAACSNLGTLYYRDGRYVDAARMYEWAVEFDEALSDYTVWGNLAQAYARVVEERHKADQMYQKAIEMAEGARRENPSDPIVLAFLAGYYADVGNGAQSRLRIESALKMAPKNSEVMFRAGHAYEKLGDREKSLVWIGKAIDNGYPVEEITHDPELEELGEDPRFKLLLPDTGVE